ncbi:3,4-dihydroxy-2-butanone-4-phosphate synthase [Bounagaea algeriensis]
MSAATVAADRCAGDALGTVEDALASLRSGRPVLVADEREPAWPSHVVLPAALAEATWVAWAVRYTSGLLCAALPGEWADWLDLPPMVRPGTSTGAVYTVAVDAARGVTTGISAADRARTARVLAAPDSDPDDLIRPGHVLGLRTGAEGVLGHRGFAETAVDLCTLAGLSPIGLIAAVTEPAEGWDGAAALAKRYELPVVTVGELIQYRLVHGDGRKGRVARGTRRSVSTSQGQFDVIGYHDHVTGAGHLALLSPTPPAGQPLVAVHVECLTGDVLGDADCDCRRRFDEALANTAVHGGAVIYLRHDSGTADTATKPDCDGAVAASAVEAGAAAAIVADLGMTEIHFDRENTAVAELARSGTHLAG